jgi:hypothetical protein
MGDSWGLTLLLIVVVLVVVVVAAVAIGRRRGERRTPAPHDVEGPRRNADGSRPEHLDPDPERLAGGRARFTPPPREPRR